METTPRILLAAFGSGSGKTLMTCALLRSLQRGGRQCAAYKCGPDYIDPLFHREVIGVPSRNLDLYFQGEAQLGNLFAESLREYSAEIAVIEGVMGLYDGLGGILSEASSYHVAKCLNTPIVLVVNARGMGRSLLPLLAGFLQYDEAGLIRGVILNQTTENLYNAIAPEIERELGIAALGYFPTCRDLELESRHLGLKLPGELEALERKLDRAAEELERCVRIDRLLELAQQAGALPESARERETLPEPAGEREICPGFMEAPAEATCPGGEDAPVLAVARDEVFCFLYEENLSLLRREGLRIAFFSPLHDACLPAGACGIWLPGGYPELAADRLSRNLKMRAAIRQRIEDGMPSVAECGGFLYLQEILCDEAGERYSQVGVLPGTACKKERPVRFGYVEIRERRAHFLPEGEGIRGHEFHYYDSDNNGADCIATKPVSAKSWECIHVTDSHWWGFPHLYLPSNPHFARHFAASVREWKNGRT